MTRSERIRHWSYILFIVLVLMYWAGLFYLLPKNEAFPLMIGVVSYWIIDESRRNLQRRLDGATSEEIKEMDPELRKLFSLDQDWDSGEVEPVELEVALHTSKLRRVLLSKPTYVPMDDGGVQLEWHQEGFSIEIEVQTDLEIDALFTNIGRGL